MTKIKAIEKGFVSVDIERFFDLAGIEKPLPVIEEIPPILPIENTHQPFWKVYTFSNIICEIKNRIGK